MQCTWRARTTTWQGLPYAVLMLLAAGCTSAKVRPADGVTPLSPTGGIEAVAEGEGVFGEWVSAGGIKREYAIHLPAAYDPGRPWPLMLVFHGGGGNRHIAEDVGLLAAGERGGYVVVSPFGVAGSWALACGGCTAADAANVDDVGFVATLVEHLSEHVNIDRERIYGVGVSDGGSFLNRLACSYPITASAVVIGTMFLPPALCAPPRDVSVVGFHGSGDDIIHISAGWGPMEMWAALNGCDPVAEVTPLPDLEPADRTTVSRYDFPGCDGGTEVVFYAIDGGGHNYPGTGGGRGLPNFDIDATEEIMKFFERHQGLP